MKQKLLQSLRLRLALIVALLCSLGTGTAWGAEKTLVYSVTSKTAVTLQNTSTGSFSGTVTFANSGSNNNDQMTSGNTMTLTLASFPYRVTKVSLNLKRSSKDGAGSVSISHNNNTIGSGSKAKSALTTSYTNYDFTCTDTQTEGNLVVLLTSSATSFWCNQFTITYDDTPAKTLSSIAVTTAPTKTAYKIGENLDLTGMVVTGTYSDESTNAINNYTMKIGDDAIQNGDILSSAGNKTITISYGGKTATQNITVASVTALSVKTAPTVKYRIGDNLDLTGLVLTATYSDEGTKDINTGFTASPTDGSALNTAGNVEVTLGFYGQNCTQRVTVGNLSSITYNSTGGSAFANTTYTEKETFNPEGLVVTAHFDNDLDAVVATGYTLSPDTETELQTTDENVTVSYTWNAVEKTVNIPITVNAGTKYTVSFDPGNGTYTGGDKTETEYQGGVVMPTPTGIPDGWSFYGWAASKQTSETNEAPSVTVASATYYPTANVTLYAVYSLVEGGEKTVTGSDLSGSATTATKLNASHPITYKISSSNAYSNPLRVYKNNTLTIAGATMSKIVLSGEDGSYPISNLDLSSGGGSLSDGTWTGSSTSVVFSASAQARVSSIKVTYTSSSTTYTSLPAPKAELSYAGAEYDAALGRSFTKPTLTNTNGVTVTYESEDEDVATVDDETGDVTIVGLGTTTITASFAGNASYRANSASYTLNVVYGTIAQIKALTNDATAKNFEALLQDAVVTYVNGNYAYLQDASAAVMVNFESHGLTEGNKINGIVSGTVKANNQIDILTAFDISEADVTDDGDIPAAAVKTLAEIKAAGTAYDGKLVTVNGVTVSKPSTTTNLADGSKIDEVEVSFTMYSPNSAASANDQEQGNFTGFVSIYNGSTYRLNIYEQSQISLTRNAPTAQPLTFVNDAVELGEETDAYTSFTGQAVSGAQGTVTYSIDSDDDGVVTSIVASTGVVTLSGICGTATIKASAAAKEVTEAGVTTPYTATTKTYTITVYPRYTVTFSVNDAETELRQATHGAPIAVPSPSDNSGFKFVGWSTSTVSLTNVAPSMETLGATITPENNDTYYAVFASATVTPDVEYTSTFTIKQSSAPSSPYVNNGSSWTWSNVTFQNDNNACIDKTSGSITFTLPAGGKAVSLNITKTGNAWAGAAAVVLKDASSNTVNTYTGSSVSFDFTEGTYDESSSYTLTNTTGSNAWVDHITFVYTADGVSYKNYCTTVPAHVNIASTAGYTTYVATDNVSFPVGATAYIATAVNPSTIHLDEVVAVPEGTAVVVKGDKGVYLLDVEDAGDCDDVSGNLLEASNGFVEGDGSTIFALGVGKVAPYAGQVGFYPVVKDAAVPAGKAYMVIPAGGSSTKGFTFDFSGLATGINTIANSQQPIANSPIYNLAGQRVDGSRFKVNGSGLKTGIYIVNGKKVLVK